jgi:IPT/TIG domain
MIQPQSVTLLPYGSQHFSEPKARSWAIRPSLGEINRETGLYRAPWFVLISRTVDVIALDNNNQEIGHASITISSARNWVAVLGLFWAFLSVGLLITLFAIWPPPAPPPSVAIYPPVATLHPGDNLQFLSSATGNGPDAVLWNAGDGQITPPGVFTAPATPIPAPPAPPPKPINVTATRESDRTQIATAQVYINDRKLVMDDSVVDASNLSAGDRIEFRAMGPHGPETSLQWYLSGPGKLSNTGVYTVRDKSTAQAVVTAVDPGGGRQAAAVVRLSAARYKDDSPMLLLVLIMGAFGALLGAMRSFVTFVGNRTFIPSWGFYYFSRPVFGGGLALIVFFAYRIGAITTPQGASPADPFTAAFVAGMVGLFADTVLQKLHELILQLFRPADSRSDKVGSSSTGPGLTSVAVNQGTLIITGTNFAAGATVSVNGEGLHPSSFTPTRLAVTLPPGMLAKGGPLNVIVTNADGGKSSVMTVSL